MTTRRSTTVPPPWYRVPQHRLDRGVCEGGGTRRRPISSRNLLTLAVLSATLIGATAAARADTGPVGTLTCTDGATYAVTGYGKGIALHVVASTSTFVVTYAVTSSGTVVRDVKGQQAKSPLLCTTTSPITGNSYTFQGFFTPNGPPNEQTY